MNIVDIAIAKSYTRSSLTGTGALKGEKGEPGKDAPTITNINIDENIKYEWARIPHFYSDFYVYKYATGVSAAIAIATKILNREPGFVERYIDMLKQGCSKKSIDLLKMVDVDLESKETYEYTIKFYEEKIEELEKIFN